MDWGVLVFIKPTRFIRICLDRLWFWSWSHRLAPEPRISICCWFPQKHLLFHRKPNPAPFMAHCWVFFYWSHSLMITWVILLQLFNSRGWLARSTGHDSELPGNQLKTSDPQIFPLGETQQRSLIQQVWLTEGISLSSLMRNIFCRAAWKYNNLSNTNVNMSATFSTKCALCKILIRPTHRLTPEGGWTPAESSNWLVGEAGGAVCVCVCVCVCACVRVRACVCVCVCDSLSGGQNVRVPPFSGR